jgi:hypothetical protein
MMDLQTITAAWFFRTLRWFGDVNSPPILFSALCTVLLDGTFYLTVLGWDISWLELSCSINCRCCTDGTIDNISSVGMYIHHSGVLPQSAYISIIESSFFVFFF